MRKIENKTSIINNSTTSYMQKYLLTGKQIKKEYITPNAHLLTQLHTDSHTTRPECSVGTKGDFQHFRVSEKHAGGTKRLAGYNLQLVFHSDLNFRCNHY